MVIISTYNIKRFLFGLPLFLLLGVPQAYSQGVSYDNNRWYEIEVSIFTNQRLNSQDREQGLPAKMNFTYPATIRELSAATTSYTYDFSTESANTQPVLSATALPIAANLPFIGPEFSPASNTFQIIDFKTDAFISLGSEQQQFTEINGDINRSNEHRLLYHNSWRQPVLNKTQASAIFIRGGDQYGEHNELEGSITLSFNVNRVDIDTQLWLNSFMANINNGISPWLIPDQAFNNANASGQLQNSNNAQGSFVESAQGYFIEDVALMDETRQMRSNEFHYLDHPDFGLLIQIRPYQLPNDFDLSID